MFQSVSEPLALGPVKSLEIPGGNITGTSDYLDTNTIMNIIFAANPEADKIGLLYDIGQDSSTTAIAQAKVYLIRRVLPTLSTLGQGTPYGGGS